MSEWSKLSPDLKICVVIYRENQAKREVWRTRLCQLLEGELTKQEISKNEDRLMDLGVLDSEYRKVDGLWTSCFSICSEAKGFIDNVSENLTGYPVEGGGQA